jgi:hypothetical protein
MELWELTARESIRDLVARYNANGDTGRFEQVLELFAPDAVMELDGGRRHTGLAEIATIFTGASAAFETWSGPVYLRHFTATHQIDVIDRTRATGRCYYAVMTSIGLDHWGRYVDEYGVVDGRWRFTRRKVTTDGRTEGGWASLQQG